MTIPSRETVEREKLSLTEDRDRIRKSVAWVMFAIGLYLGLAIGSNATAFLLAR